MDHTIQRQTITSQCLGGLLRSSSIARPSVLLYGVSPRVLPEAVTPAVTLNRMASCERLSVGVACSLPG